MILIFGALFSILFLYNTYVSFANKQQLITLRANKLINIQNKVEEIDLSKFRIIQRTNALLTIKKRWRTIEIHKDDFSNAENILDKIELELRT